MKVAAGEHRRLAGFLVEKDERIIGGRVQLDAQHPASVEDGIAHCAVHLGDAAQRVGVLHVERVVGPGKGAAGNELAQKSSALDLARVGSGGVDARVEGAGRAVQRFQAQAASHVGGAGQVLGLAGGQHAHGSHKGRAVGQCQALFGLQRHRRQPGPGQCLGSRQALALVDGLAQPDEGQ